MHKLLSCVTAATCILLLAGVGWAKPVEITAEAPGVLLPTGFGGTVLSFDELPVGNLPSYQFNGGALSGAGAIENTSIKGISAQPAGTGTGYLTASYPSAAGATRFNFSNPENYFGLYWGSMDSWNSITFLRSGQQVATYSGTDVAGLTGLVANGDQQSRSSNRYINFDLGAAVYDEVVLSTFNWGFEVDNIAFGDASVLSGISAGGTASSVDTATNAHQAVVVLPMAVPEPGTLALLGSSFCGFVVARRRRVG